MGEMISERIEIALCDDEEILRRKLKIMLYDILKKEGISGTVKDYASGEELLKDIEQFDLVFLDIDMPGMNGIDVGRKIQQRIQIAGLLWHPGGKTVLRKRID